MEVEIATKDLVCTLPAEDHLVAHGLDTTGKQVQGHSSPHLRKFCQEGSSCEVRVHRNFKFPIFLMASKGKDFKSLKAQASGIDKAKVV